MHVLVTGGAGYIGSICARHLIEAGHRVTTLDDLSTGHRQAAQGELVVQDVRDRAGLAALFARHRFDGVMHFAAKSLVGESVARPLAYVDTNVGGTVALVEAMLEAKVQALVFSSTCAIYGDPERLPLDEDHPWRPVSPYGESKAMVETLLRRCRDTMGLRATTLRYFNAAGATADASLGEAHEPETHLLPLALDAALGRRPPLQIFGTDYETRDGTCVRDYVHVLDLATAHRLALERLVAGDGGGAYNLGTGTGSTVLEVLRAVERAVGRPVPHVLGPRRPGDALGLYAQASKAERALGWVPMRGLDDIVASAAAWARGPRFARDANAESALKTR